MQGPKVMTHAANPAAWPASYYNHDDIDMPLVWDLQRLLTEPMEAAADETEASMAQHGLSARRQTDQPAGDAFPRLGSDGAAAMLDFAAPSLSTTAYNVLPTTLPSWAWLESAESAQTRFRVPVSIIAPTSPTGTPVAMAPAPWPAAINSLQSSDLYTAVPPVPSPTVDLTAALNSAVGNDVADNFMAGLWDPEFFSPVVSRQA